MIVHHAGRDRGPRRPAANREMALGLVVLALLSAMLVHYALGFACRDRSSWPCRPGDVARTATGMPPTAPPPQPPALLQATYAPAPTADPMPPESPPSLPATLPPALPNPTSLAPPVPTIEAPTATTEQDSPLPILEPTLTPPWTTTLDAGYP